MTENIVKFQTLSDSALKAEIALKAPPEKVYAAWTEQGRFMKWFAPGSGGHLQVDQFDPSVGGRYDVTMVFADGDRARITGTYLELDPPKKIVFTWQWVESPVLSPETLVTVELVSVETGTHLTLTHERFLSEKSRTEHQEGWGSLLPVLASLLTNTEEA
ncbi:SRPBCC domain-containing protein [bacterium]|nr:MAG: SRPBCC domain-containing protein [bacterium]